MNQPHPTPHVGEYDPSLGRIRHHTDDFFDHRKLVLKHIQEAMAAEKKNRGK